MMAVVDNDALADSLDDADTRADAPLVSAKPGHAQWATADQTSWSLTNEFSRRMRRAPTSPEAALWEALRGSRLGGAKFRRQHVVGEFIADFICLRSKLIIEVDGGIHQEPDHVTYDAIRTSELQKRGFQVIRFTNDQVLYKLPAVLLTIQKTIESTSSKSAG